MSPPDAGHMAADWVWETPRLHLRRLLPEDDAFILGLLNQPSFLRFIGDRGVRTLEDARAYIAKGPGASYAQHGFGLYHLMLRATAEPIGMCGLLQRDTLPDPDVGFALLPQFWGQGYASEAAAAMLEHGQRDFGMKRILGITAEDNLASGSVLLKIGMRYDGLHHMDRDRGPIRLYVWEAAS